MKCIATCWIAGVVLVATGCQAIAPSTARTVPGVPTPFTLELRTHEPIVRSVYYVLKEDGTLEYGAGRAAVTRTARPIGSLSDADLQRIWKLIESRGLLAAEGSLFASGNREYEFQVTAGDARNRVLAADDQVPALRELDDLLFEIQRTQRFKD